MTENELSKIIIGCAIEVHRELGPGLLESAYRDCLYHELSGSGLMVEKEKKLPVLYKDLLLEQGYRIDLLVEEKVVIELKAIEKFTDVHTAQILTYLRLGGYQLGLLMNFNVKLLKQGIKRFVL